MEEKNKIPIGSAPKSDPIPFGFGTPTSDYNRLRNRPKINGTTIEGDKGLDAYGYEEISNFEIEEMMNL